MLELIITCFERDDQVECSPLALVVNDRTAPYLAYDISHLQCSPGFPLPRQINTPSHSDPVDPSDSHDGRVGQRLTCNLNNSERFIQFISFKVPMM